MIILRLNGACSLHVTFPIVFLIYFIQMLQKTRKTLKVNVSCRDVNLLSDWQKYENDNELRVPKLCWNFMQDIYSCSK